MIDQFKEAAHIIPIFIIVFLGMYIVKYCHLAGKDDFISCLSYIGFLIFDSGNAR